MTLNHPAEPGQIHLTPLSRRRRLTGGVIPWVQVFWDRSNAGWSQAGDEALPHTAPGAQAEKSRYTPVDIAGRGGMGEVLIVHDERLGRDVALKRIPIEAESMSVLVEKLQREAQITARLEHPSIVPVYDTDRDSQGHVYYTMRLIQGRSLAEILATDSDSLSLHLLLRHFLAACQAVAFAHSRDIVHRDLKPANLMVGPFGETQVLDWGLAICLHDQAAHPTTTSALHQAALPAGTPAYMSPEQAAGQRVDATADVWALGIVLQDIVASTTPSSSRRRPAYVAELQAIIDKATATTKTARYANASELAQDLSHYLDGRRVNAHDYSTLELAKRLVRRLRVPLLVLLAGLTAATLALSFSVRRIQREHARAVTAEASTHHALTENRRVTSWTLTRQAVSAARAGALADAALLAAHALASGESPEARGVLVASQAGTSPQNAEIIAIPGCQRAMPVSWERALCLGENDISSWRAKPLAKQWSVSIAAKRIHTLSNDRLAVVDENNLVLLLHASRGAELARFSPRVTTGHLGLLAESGSGEFLAVSESRILTVFSTTERTQLDYDRVCLKAELFAIMPWHEGFLLACTDGQVMILDPIATTLEPMWERGEISQISPVVAALSPDQTVFSVGGIRGDVVSLDLTSGHVLPQRKHFAGAIRWLGALANSDRFFAVADENGDVLVWDGDTQTESFRLPHSSRQFHRAEVEGLVSGGDSIRRWRLPTVLRPRALQLPVGIGTLAFSRARSWLALGRSDGAVELRDVRDGSLVDTFTLGTGVIKSIEFAADGNTLLVSLAEPKTRPFVIDLHNRSVRQLEIFPPRSCRHLLFDSKHNIVGPHWAPPLSYWSTNSLDGSRLHHSVEAPEMIDVAATADRTTIFLLDIQGGLWRWLGDGIQAIGNLPTGALIATSGTSGQLAAVDSHGLLLRDSDGTIHRMAASSNQVTALGVSADGKAVVSGARNGDITIWSTESLQPLAVLHGHDQRVSEVVFATDSIMYSAGWDGRVLRWDLSVLDTSPARLIAEVEATWGVKLSDILPK